MKAVGRRRGAPRAQALALAATLCVAGFGCDDGAGGAAGDAALADASADVGPAPEPLPTPGLWTLAIEFVEVGNLVLGFQLAVAVADAPPRLSQVILRVVDQDGSVSGDLATLTDLPIEGGRFTADFVDVTLPAAFSPTGTDILAALTLAGEIRDADFMCGAVSGDIKSLSIPIAVSTFGAVPWADGLVGPASCDGTKPRTPDARTGGDRPAAVYLPAGHSDRDHWPLVVVLHGYSTNGTLQAAYLGLTAPIDARGYVLLVPEGTVDGEGNQFWNATAAWSSYDPDGVDDVAYLRGLIDEVARDHRVDRGRVYVVAHSNGAFMAYVLACAGVPLAGVATLEGGEAVDGDACAPAAPTRILHLHGTEDTSVPYAGRADARPFPGAVETIERWATRNGCGAPPVEGPPIDLASNEGAETIPVRYPGCAAKTELWRIEGGVHVPGLEAGFADLVLGALMD